MYNNDTYARGNRNTNNTIVNIIAISVFEVYRLGWDSSILAGRGKWLLCSGGCLATQVSP